MAATGGTAMYSNNMLFERLSRLKRFLFLFFRQERKVRVKRSDAQQIIVRARYNGILSKHYYRVQS